MNGVRSRPFSDCREGGGCGRPTRVKLGAQSCANDHLGRPGTRASHRPGPAQAGRAAGPISRRPGQATRSKRSTSLRAPAQTGVTVGTRSGTDVPVTVLPATSTESTVMIIGPLGTDRSRHLEPSGYRPWE